MFHLFWSSHLKLSGALSKACIYRYILFYFYILEGRPYAASSLWTPSGPEGSSGRRS